MRWYIAENKKRIASENFEGHSDHIEMNGEQVSGVITYAVKYGEPYYKRRFAYPDFRIQPNNTHGTYQPECNEAPIVFEEQELFDRVEWDGVLSVYSHAGNLKIVRKFYPSTTVPVFYEQIELYNGGKQAVSPKWETHKRLENKLACEGYVYFERVCETPCREVAAGEKVTLLFCYSARFANKEIPYEENPIVKRRVRVEELMLQCDITTGNEIVDTMFAFAKLRAGESLFRTNKGIIHSPGGMAFYAAIWCNDQCEYVAPWFAFTGDKLQAEAIENIYGWYYPYFNDDYLPIPSSIICGGYDYWNGAGDRGDAEMYLYGLSRVLLTQGKLPNEEQKKALDWCVEYIKKNITEDGVVLSDSDELENRISSGINLNTSSLAYGGLENYAVLLKRMGKADEAEKLIKMQKVLGEAIENYFGGEIGGYHTYHYHKGCDVIRAWNALPVYMGITNRAKDTLKSIGEKLWTEGSCRSTEGEKILWDRSALYYIMALFRAGETEKAWEKLKEYSESRLLGEHVPYAVEAYPEGGMRHLSAESGLFCRVFTDGLLNIKFDEKGYEVKGTLPEELNQVIVKNIYMNGKSENLMLQVESINIEEKEGGYLWERK